MNVFGREMRQPKTFVDGTHRSQPPQATLDWLSPVAWDLGVTRLANVTGLDCIGVPVWVAVRPNSKGLATSQGKGLTHEAAKVSALMESVENWHAETVDHPVRVCDADRILKFGSAVHPLSVSHYADAPPRADQAIAWVEGFDLVSETPCWTPLETVSTDYTLGAFERRAEVFVQSSNGLAGGNHMLEALCHALFEVVERHALACDAALVSGFDLQFRIALESVEDPGCRALISRIEDAGLLVGLWRLPTSFGIPTFACSIVDSDAQKRWRTLPPFNGYGCHLDPAVALGRAISEAVQSRVTYISGSRDDISAAEYARAGNPDDLDSFRARLQHGQALGRFDQVAGRAGAAFEDDLQAGIAALRAAGYDQVVAVDLSKPQLGIPVVKVVVPGLASPSLLIRGRPVQAPRSRAEVMSL